MDFVHQKTVSMETTALRCVNASDKTATLVVGQSYSVIQSLMEQSV